MFTVVGISPPPRAGPQGVTARKSGSSASLPCVSREVPVALCREGAEVLAAQGRPQVTLLASPSDDPPAGAASRLRVPRSEGPARAGERVTLLASPADLRPAAAASRCRAPGSSVLVRARGMAAAGGMGVPRVRRPPPASGRRGLSSVRSGVLGRLPSRSCRQSLPRVPPSPPAAGSRRRRPARYCGCGPADARPEAADGG